MIFPSGSLAFASGLNNGQVELTVGVAENNPDSDEICVPIIANEFNQVDAFTLALRWYPTTENIGIRLVSIGNPHPNLEADALSYSFNPRISRATIGYTPSLPGGVSLMAGDTLLEMCFASSDSCASVIITEQTSSAETSFTSYDSFSEWAYPVSHKINDGGLAFYQGLVQLSLDTVTTSDENELVELSVRNLHEVVPVQGTILLKFPTDSLSLTSVSVNAPLNASISFQEHPDGAVVRFNRANPVEGELWPEGEWFTFTFSTNFGAGAVKVKITLRESSNLLTIKNDAIVRLPTNFFPGLIIVTDPVAVNERQFVDGLLYPNPINAGQELTVIAPELTGKTADLRLVDITGRVISTSPIIFDGTGRANYRLPSQPQGVYLISLSTKSGNSFYGKVLVR